MSQVIDVPIEQLVPREDQPRQHFGEESIQRLADSIRSQGFIGQVTVRKQNGHYELLAGHRRRLAAMEAGLSELPAVVVDLDDQEATEFVLLDNLNREDMLPWECGAGFAELVDLGLSMEAVAQKAGMSLSFVSGRISLAENAGESLKQAYLDEDVNLASLVLLARLPNQRLSPILCPQCKRVNAEGSTECAACGRDLSDETAIPAPGNPQDAACRLAKGKSVDGVKQIIEKVKQSYGLSDEPVQTSLGFSDRQLSNGAVRTKSKLQRRLAKIGSLDSWHLQTIDDRARELPADQQQAVLAAFRQAQATLAAVEKRFRMAAE